MTMKQRQDSVQLRGGMRPVLFDGDVIVAGGSFGGIAACLTLARSGRRVVLVEPRTYLGREITATQRPWLPASKAESPMPELIAECIGLDGTVRVGNEYALHLDALKTRLEDLILDLGVELYYASFPVGVVRDGGRLEGLVIANKSGRQVIRGKTVIDATETALVARLAGAEFACEEGSVIYRRTLEFDRVGDLSDTVLSVPEGLQVFENEVVVHQGCYGPGHVYVDYGVMLPQRVTCLAELRALKTRTENKGLELIKYLRDNVPAIGHHSVVGSSSYEPDGPLTDTLAGPGPEWARAYDAHLVTAELDDGGVFRAPVPCFAGPIAGLWCLSEAARLEAGAQDLFRDPAMSSRIGASLAAVVTRRAPDTTASAQDMGKVVKPRSTVCIRGELETREQEWPQRGKDYPSAAVEPRSIPVVEDGDVLVVGGGSSGAVAAITAAQEGLRSVVVDMNPGLGGTGTYGGINTYWFARRIGFVDRLMGWLDEIHDRLDLPRPKGVMATWNVEARIAALREKAEEAGAAMLLNALVFGAVVQDQEVRGVVAATSYGPLALLGSVTLDATGDGDVAAWAGAQYLYGSDREHAVMWGYMPQIVGPGLPRNVKTSMVDTTNIRDYVRMILAERRRRQKGDYDHGLYLAPRESRHILGQVVMSLTDQLVRRCWPDVAFIAFSNYDMKGESTSDWVRMGIQPPNLEIEIPYRALVPNGIESILVVGKAFSATHDALAAPRMQPDMENLGGVAAIAAAMALKGGVRIRDVDVRALQERLVEIGALPASVLTRNLAPMDYADEQLEALIEGLTADRPLHDYSNQEIGEPFERRIPEVDIMCSGPRVIPLLEAALRSAKGRRKVLLAQMLAMLGSRAGAPVLVEAVEELLKGDELPGRDHPVRHIGLPPDQGADPEAAHLLYALTLAKDTHALPLWRRIVDLLATATEEQLFDRNWDLYGYAAAVCYGAERLGHPEAVPILEKLHSYPLLRNQMSLSGYQPDILEERLAYLEILVGRALARCGSPHGFIILINYLDDVRASLAEHAHEELIAITGQDYGKDMSAWANWLEMVGDDLEPKPYQVASEPVAAWGQTYLIEKKPAG